MADSVVRLAAGPLELELSPSIGGAISRFQYIGDGGRTPILRKSHTCPAKVLDAGSFPLVPFVNRIRGGAFSFRGRTVRLAPNMAGDASPLHGQGWLNAWDVEAAGAAAATLRYRHAVGEWPWDYEAVQHFSLDAEGLSLALVCRNLSADPMPCGLGQHPYFPCGPETRIATDVIHVWTIDEHVLPVEKVPATGRFDLSDRAICGQDLDHGFGGWGGSAFISDPGWPFAVRLASPAAHYFQLFSPASGGFFVAEPVTHANAALNAPEEQWADLGIEVLEPGAELRLDLRIDVIPAPSRG